MLLLIDINLMRHILQKNNNNNNNNNNNIWFF